MKKRYEEVSHNLAYIQAQLDEHGINAQIQARQLYHDREEVTVHVRRIWAAVGWSSRRAITGPRPEASSPACSLSVRLLPKKWTWRSSEIMCVDLIQMPNAGFP